MAMVLSLVFLGLCVLAMAGLYLWTRRTESYDFYEPVEKDEEQANALRLGIALNSPASNLGGR